MQRKGLDKSVFWYETTYRREEPTMTDAGARKMPSDAYDPKLLACHHNFSKVCEDHASFKVVLLAGVMSGKTFKQRYRHDSYEISDENIWIHAIRDEDGRLERIAVSMPHPEAFLRALSGQVRYPYRVAREYDAAINIATVLAGTHLDISEKYFQQLLEDRYSGPDTVEDFQESPMSALMTERRREIAAEKTTPFERMPLTIVRYIQKELGLKSAEEVQLALRSEEKTYLQMAHSVMYGKSWTTRKSTFHRKMAESTVAFERTVEMRTEKMGTVCKGCGKHHAVDASPLFGTREPVKGVYIARTTEQCPSKECAPAKGKKVSCNCINCRSDIN
jgi:hypothetical protein